MAKKILLVDDDREIATLLQHVLERDGYRVVAVSQGAEAIPTAEKEMPDAILMDVHMADADGLTVLRALKQHADLKDVPVVMLSGMYMEEECRAAGAAGFILKPYPPGELRTTLAKVLAGETIPPG